MIKRRATKTRGVGNTKSCLAKVITKERSKFHQTVCKSTMVGEMTASKPSRSDEVLDSEEQVKIANQIRAQFDSMAPKRPSKPNRSEPDIPFSPNPVDPSTDLTIPELHKLRSLQSQSQVSTFQLCLSLSFGLL